MSEKRILLAEDSEDDAELVVVALRQSGVGGSIDVVRDGEEAVSVLLDAAGDVPRPLPAVVLLDIKLPKLDGFEVLRRIRASDPTRFLPVVMLTSSDVPGDIVRAYELGANSYVRKSVDFAQFSESLNLVARYWLNLNETASS